MTTVSFDHVQGEQPSFYKHNQDKYTCSNWDENLVVVHTKNQSCYATENILESIHGNQGVYKEENGEPFKFLFLPKRGSQANISSRKKTNYKLWATLSAVF